MAKKDITGFALPFGLKGLNPMMDADAYAGPYDSLQDALDTIVEAVRVPGRRFAVYTDANRRAVEFYEFYQDAAGVWRTKKKSGGSAANAVEYIPQALTAAQKTQAQANIGVKFNETTENPNQNYIDSKM